MARVAPTCPGGSSEAAVQPTTRQAHDFDRPQRRTAALVRPASVLVGAYLALTLGMIAAGRLITAWGEAVRWDDRASQWLSVHRTPFITSAAHWGTFLADTQSVVVVALSVTVILVVRHWGRLALLLLCGLGLELAIFLTSNSVVRRPRPSVPHIGSTPSTFSFPSGHVAATIVLYGGVALLVAAASRRLIAHVSAWTMASLLPGWVGFSRVYQGQHHVFDVLAGVLLGLAVLIATGVAARLSVGFPERPTSPHATPGDAAERATEPVAAPGIWRVGTRR